MRRRQLAALLIITAMLPGCGGGHTFGKKTYKPKKDATSRPYKIKGKTYRPQHHYEYDKVGVASFYGDGEGFHGRKTSTGEVYNTNAFTAAHKTLPLPCVVKVTNLTNGKSIKLKVNDRGPFVKGRIIDVSRAAAKRLGFYKNGITKVRVQTLVGESARMHRTKGYWQQAVIRSNSNVPVRNMMPLSATRAHTPKLQKPTYISYGYGRPHAPSAYSKKAYLQNASITTAPANKGIFIQAGTFGSQRNAQSLKNQLSSLVKHTVSLHNSPGKDLVSVRVGPFSSRAAAQARVKELANLGFKDTLLIHR